MRSTHTFAELGVSAAAYDEIAGKLREAGYDHAFIEATVGSGGLVIDMHGIGLVRGPEDANPSQQETEMPEKPVESGSGYAGSMPYYERNADLRARIEKDFGYHPPKESQPERYRAINDACARVAYILAGMCPPGRDLSLALTKLEEVRMRANKAIAVGEAE